VSKGASCGKVEKSRMESGARKVRDKEIVNRLALPGVFSNFT